jgi:hypothetical protein
MHRPAFEEALTRYTLPEWGSLVTTLRALLDGARDEDALCDRLDLEDGLIVTTIFRCLTDPAVEQSLLSDTV